MVVRDDGTDRLTPQHAGEGAEARERKEQQRPTALRALSRPAPSASPADAACAAGRTRTRGGSRAAARQPPTGCPAWPATATALEPDRLPRRGARPATRPAPRARPPTGSAPSPARR